MADDNQPQINPKWTRRAVLGGLAAGAAGAIGWANNPDPVKRAAPATTDGSPPPTEPQIAPAATHPPTTQKPAPPKRISIKEENAKLGTSNWAITQDPARWDRIRGFASRTSVAQGEEISLYISTAASHYQVSAYRMGYYGGKGGRLVWQSERHRATQQAPPRVHPDTNMRDAPWKPSLTFTIDEKWVPGSYLFKLNSSDGGQSQIPLVVRDDHHPNPLVHIQHDVTTWQAYNLWGGASLYEGDNGRSTKVSFDRPYGLSGSGNFLGGVREIAMLVEYLGYEVTYSTSLDTHARPDDCAKPKVWISPAHDEYWSWEMREGVNKAREKGVNFMILGANCMFRRIRLENSFIGPNRIQVNYRDPKLDPMTGKDDKRVTTSWREGPYPYPESSFTGTFYESNPVSADMVIADADAWMFQGTGLRNGDKWPSLVGNEYDRVTLEVPTPSNIQVLAHSPLVCRDHFTFADMTYYTHYSGAGVFSTGSIWFERHLAPPGNGYNRQIIKLVTNILDVFTKGPAGKTHPAKSNLQALGIHAGYLPTTWVDF